MNAIESFEQYIKGEFQSHGVEFRDEDGELAIEATKIPEMFHRICPDIIRSDPELYGKCLEEFQQALDPSVKRGVWMDGQLFVKESAIGWGLAGFGVLAGVLILMGAPAGIPGLLGGLIAHGYRTIIPLKGMQRDIAGVICMWRSNHHGDPPIFAELYELVKKINSVTENELLSYLRNMENAGILKRIKGCPLVYDLS